MKTTLSKRFGKLKLGLISTSKDVVAWGESLGLFYTQHIDEEIATSDLVSKIIDIVAPGAPVDCLVVDASDSSSARSWKRVDAIVQACLDHTPHLYKSVLAQAEVHVEQQKSQPWDHLIPIQSATIKDGVPVQVNDTYVILNASLHDGTTRRDTTQIFDAAEIISKGCNSATLAYHFLLEIGHKLGYVPKYGA
ncbi:hypothetical protein BCR43DRAFT_116029 [Syncephalastrum racemosum]|uniref:Uncharacterized protein n=1 Tax=Syncephalastrum racemosum TaxID=13706 RepID=A0A1X2H0I4_SYNRA|nr:hypothetical protein BCR43DRAFT_116029 [Syncephalastrum racemosum]